MWFCKFVVFMELGKTLNYLDHCGSFVYKQLKVLWFKFYLCSSSHTFRFKNALKNKLNVKKIENNF